MADYKKAEEILIESQALLTGHFLLTSGRHAGQYMQCARVQQYPDRLTWMAKPIAEGFAGDQIDIVVGPAIGGIVIGYELARQLGAKSVFTERADGKMELRRGFEIPKGAKVIVAEDVVTTGLSTKEVIEVCKQYGADVVGVGVMVDRTGGKLDFGVKFVSAYAREIASYTPEDCPICKAGEIALVKPGSRQLPK
ncbi:MAG: orotate phosphoribosyltransferase [Oscillospiraceae bacterium]|nr:orotate phosphoribosyltransferase [Oscillospiraceae bacterium]